MNPQVCVYNWIGHAYGSSIMGFSMLWVSAGFVMGKHSAEINLTDDTRTYLNTVLTGSLSKLNFQPTSSQSYSLKYDLHNDVLLVMHNAFCVSSKRGWWRETVLFIIFHPWIFAPLFLLFRFISFCFSCCVYLMSWLDSLLSIDYCYMSVFLPLGDRNKDGPSRMQ